MRHSDYDDDPEYDEDEILDVMFNRDDEFDDETDGCGSFMG